jgi:mono/diheme cytochrome c family protein
MVTWVQAMPKDAFDAWYAAADERQSKVDVQLGEEQWAGACAKCHGMDGEGDYGPAIQGGTLTNVEKITTTIRNGKGRMPAVGAEWTDLQVDSLNAYLKERAGGS